MAPILTNFLVVKVFDEREQEPYLAVVPGTWYHDEMCFIPNRRLEYHAEHRSMFEASWDRLKVKVQSGHNSYGEAKSKLEEGGNTSASGAAIVENNSSKIGDRSLSKRVEAQKNSSAKEAPQNLPLVKLAKKRPASTGVTPSTQPVKIPKRTSAPATTPYTFSYQTGQRFPSPIPSPVPSSPESHSSPPTSANSPEILKSPSLSRSKTGGSLGAESPPPRFIPLSFPDADTQRVFLEEFGNETDEDDVVVTGSTPRKTAEMVHSSNASASTTTDISSNPTPSTSASAGFPESSISKNSAQSSAGRRNAPNLHQIHAKFQHWDGKSLKELKKYLGAIAYNTLKIREEQKRAKAAQKSQNAVLQRILAGGSGGCRIRYGK